MGLKTGQELTVRVTSVTKGGAVKVATTDGQVHDLEDHGTIEHPKRIKVGTILDVKVFYNAGQHLLIGVAPHYANYGS